MINSEKCCCLRTTAAVFKEQKNALECSSSVQKCGNLSRKIELKGTFSFWGKFLGTVYGRFRANQEVVFFVFLLQCGTANNGQPRKAPTINCPQPTTQTPHVHSFILLFACPHHQPALQSGSLGRASGYQRLPCVNMNRRPSPVSPRGHTIRVHHIYQIPSKQPVSRMYLVRVCIWWKPGLGSTGGHHKTTACCVCLFEAAAGSLSRPSAKADKHDWGHRNALFRPQRRLSALVQYLIALDPIAVYPPLYPPACLRVILYIYHQLSPTPTPCRPSQTPASLPFPSPCIALSLSRHLFIYYLDTAVDRMVWWRHSSSSTGMYAWCPVMLQYPTAAL